MRNARLYTTDLLPLNCCLKTFLLGSYQRMRLNLTGIKHNGYGSFRPYGHTGNVESDDFN